MKKGKRRIDKRWLRILGIVCLSFLGGSMAGAAMANLTDAHMQAELMGFLDAAEPQSIGFWAIFLKYLKYDLVIWLGGWLPLGIFLSGAAFLLRSISVGFTSALLLMTYGAKGILLSLTIFLPQNLLLIPTYSLILAAAMYYLSSWREEGGKRGLKRERRRKQAEYCILLFGSVILIAAAAGIEKMMLFL